jgi:hypothetical protein
MANGQTPAGIPTPQKSRDRHSAIRRITMTVSAQSSADTAIAYYQAMNRKDLAEMCRHLHPDVQLVSPLDRLTGRQAALNAAARFLPAVRNIEIRAQFGSEEQAMLAHDMVLNEPSGFAAPPRSSPSTTASLSAISYSSTPGHSKENSKPPRPSNPHLKPQVGDPNRRLIPINAPGAGSHCPHHTDLAS